MALTLKYDRTGTPTVSDKGRFTVYAALWRDVFDEQSGKALYVLLRDADDMPSGTAARRHEAIEEAERIVQAHLDDGAHEAGEPFEPVEDEEATGSEGTPAEDGSSFHGVPEDEDEGCRALVPAPKRDVAGVAVEPEVVPPGGCRVDDGPFELSSGPTARELRSAVLDEIEGAEKAASAARSRMKKLALVVADLRSAGMPDEGALLDFKSAQGAWMHETDALASAQERLRSLDADIAAGRLK